MTPRQWQFVMATGCVAVAVLLQVVVVSRLPLPGAAPSLALAVVLGVGMGLGPVPGAVAGFAAGLAIDVLPPATGIMGAGALALLLAGDLAGRVRDPRGLAPVQLFGVNAALAALAGAVHIGFTVALGAGGGVSTGTIVTELVGFTWWTAVVSIAVVPIVAAALRLAGGGRRTRRPRTVPG